MSIPGSGILKGFGTTFRNLFAAKVTRQYPEVRPTIPDRWRGRLDLIYDPFGEHKCEVCFQCAQVCPVEAIDMSGFDSTGQPDPIRDAGDLRRARRSERLPPCRPRRRDPMRNPARWDDGVDSPSYASWSPAYEARPEALVAIFRRHPGSLRLPPRARAASRQRPDDHPLGAGLRRRGPGRLPPPAERGHLITVCTCAACRFSGGDALLAALRQDLGIAPGSRPRMGHSPSRRATRSAPARSARRCGSTRIVYGPLTADEARHVLHQRREAAAARSVAAGTAS